MYLCLVVRLNHVYVQEKETGLGTSLSDWYNPEYRVHMDAVKRSEEERRIRKSSEFMKKFFDPELLTAKDIEHQMKELEEKRGAEKSLNPFLVKKW